MKATQRPTTRPLPASLKVSARKISWPRSLVPINAVIAALLAVSAALLLWIPFPIYFHAAGAALLVGIVIWQHMFAEVLLTKVEEVS